MIKEFPIYEINTDGDIRNISTGKNISKALDYQGYYKVCLVKDKGKHTKNVYVHRLLALTYITNEDNKPVVDHINRIRTDNNLSNLRWATLNENTQNRGDNKRTGMYFNSKISVWEIYVDNYIIGSYIEINEAFDKLKASL